MFRSYINASNPIAHVERIRGRKLQEIRKRHFSRYPLCVHCKAKGKVRSAVVLDHIQALTNGGADEESNRQGLCIPCHADKTIEDMGYRKRPAIGPDGEPIES